MICDYHLTLYSICFEGNFSLLLNNFTGEYCTINELLLESPRKTNYIIPANFSIKVLNEVYLFTGSSGDANQVANWLT